MLDLRIPVLSLTSGAGNDGIVRGSVAQTQFTRVLLNVMLSGNVFAYRMDKDVGTFTDVSTAIVSGNNNAVEPFGSVSTMSVGDGLIVACDSDVDKLYLNITRAGGGNWNGIEIYDSTDGKTFNRLLTGFTDSSNGFKNTGVHLITIPHPSPTHTSFSPSPVLGIPERRYFLFVLKGFVSVTTAPAVSRVWLQHHSENFTYSDITAAANEALTSGTFANSSDSALHAVGNEVVFALPFLAYGMDIVVHRKVADIATRAHEYLSSDGTWKPLPNFSDPSNDFENGPATLGSATQTFAVRWSIPSDWTEKTVNFNGLGNVTGYFIQYRITDISQYGPVSVPLWRGRVRAFGIANSSGMRMRTAQTFRGVTIGHIGVPNTQAAVVSLININTGKGSSITIPANPTTPSYFDLSPELVIGTGQELLVTHSSGGSLIDVELTLQV